MLMLILLTMLCMGETVLRCSGMPFVIHDLQDSQMFALAQAAGRAGFSVQGLASSMENWIECCRYVDDYRVVPSLGDVIESVYALNIKKTGFSGVWLPCVDDIAIFTAEFQHFLHDLNLKHLIASEQSMQASDVSQLQAYQGFLKIPETRWLTWDALKQSTHTFSYPLILKSSRGDFQTFASADILSAYLHQQKVSPLLQRVQSYIEGETSKMATAMLLFDANGRVVRGFTGRRLSVAQTKHGNFGETTAAKAVWIPELYAGAVTLLEHIGWQGFAEVECKQGADGHWYVMEINPRLSGWLCLAEADGAGFLQAYHALCAGDASDVGIHLQTCCLQRSRCEYIRLVAAGLHQTHWEFSGEHHPFKSLLILLKDAWRLYLGHPHVIGGAVDMLDKQASIALIKTSLKRVFGRK